MIVQRSGPYGDQKPEPMEEQKDHIKNKLSDAQSRVVLNKKDFIEMFFRSLFFPVLWNFKRVNNYGWLFCFWPVIRRFGDNEKSRFQLIKDHSSFFSSHPYFVNLVLGVIASMEQQEFGQAVLKRDEIISSKKLMSGPLAALGETFFWATWRPLLALISIIIGGLLFPAHWGLAICVFLVGYNIIHLAVKVFGISAGFKWGKNIVPFFLQLDLQRIVQSLFLLGLGLTVGTLSLLLVNSNQSWWIKGCVPLLILLLFKMKIAPDKIFYVISFFQFVVFYVRG